MKKYLIKGGKRLTGEVIISGSKNSSLPIITASLLARDRFEIKNVPELRDINTMILLLNTLGVLSEFKNNKLTIDTSNINSFEAPYELVKTMRASIYVLGPLLARYGEAKVSLPGGCSIGPRPIDLHIMAMQKLGAKITMEHGFIIAKANRLIGTVINFPKISVGATANALMGSVLAKGETIIENAAREPEISDLIAFLCKMGANISGSGTDTLRIKGVKELKGVDYSIIPDRIEAGTYIVLGALKRNHIVIKNLIPEHVRSLTDILISTGVNLKIYKSSIEVLGGKRLRGFDIETLPYPGFPTDLQPIIMILMLTIPGISAIHETIFDNRFTHIGELIRMGGDIKIIDHVAIIRESKKLQGAPIMATDLRAGAALVLASLIATGKSEVRRIYHIERGYENFEQKLSNLGANIKKIDD